MEIPKEWEPMFFIQFWDEKMEDILVNNETANQIKTAMIGGAKYIELGVSLISVSSIKMIKARYGFDNIPPRPPKIPIELINGNIELGDSELGKIWEKRYKNILTKLK
jgi:hypothetical protein